MLGDAAYLRVFNAHYAAIMRHLKRGPFLVGATMASPARSGPCFPSPPVAGRAHAPPSRPAWQRAQAD